MPATCVAVIARQPSNGSKVCSGQSKALEVPRCKADAYTASVAELGKRSQRFPNCDA
jgi:hypothetical protein